MVIKGRRLSNFALGNLDLKFLLEKLEVVLDSVKQAANLNVVSVFALRIEEEGVVGFQMHSRKSHCWNDVNLRPLKKTRQKLGMLKVTPVTWKLINVTFCATLLKDVATGCKGAVWLYALVKNHSVKRLLFEEISRTLYNDNFCLLRSLALHLHLIERLQEETFKYSIHLWEIFEVFKLKILQRRRTLLKPKFSGSTLKF